MCILRVWGVSSLLLSCDAPPFSADLNATDVYMQFQIGWMADPIFLGGDYPAVMRASQPALPRFKPAEKELIAGSADFLALNYYTSHFVAASPPGAPASQVQCLGWPAVVEPVGGSCCW